MDKQLMTPTFRKYQNFAYKPDLIPRIFKGTETINSMNVILFLILLFLTWTANMVFGKCSVYSLAYRVFQPNHILQKNILYLCFFFVIKNIQQENMLASLYRDKCYDCENHEIMVNLQLVGAIQIRASGKKKVSLMYVFLCCTKNTE